VVKLTRAAYQGGFIEHCVTAVLYPSGLTRPIQIALGMLVLGISTGSCGGVAPWRGRPPNPGMRLMRNQSGQSRRISNSMMGKNANAFDFLLGEWDITVLVMPEGSTVGRRAKSQVHRILDGTALLDEIRHLDEAGAGQLPGRELPNVRSRH
jgi:hypothetical protein